MDALGLLLLALGQEGVPGVARLGGDVGEPGAWRRIRDANQVLTGRALDLPAEYARELDPYVRDKFAELWGSLKSDSAVE